MATAIENVRHTYGNHYDVIGSYKEYTIFQKANYFMGAKDSEVLGNDYLMLIDAMPFDSKWYDDEAITEYLVSKLGTDYISASAIEDSQDPSDWMSEAFTDGY